MDGSSDGGAEGTITMAEALSQEKGFSENTKVQDKNGNVFTVPSGFKIATKEDDDTIVYTDEENPTVQEGIVIEDTTNGNQFVWIPVGDIKKEGGATDITIELARYKFDVTISGSYPSYKITGTGKSTPVQGIEDYDKSATDELNQKYRIYYNNDETQDYYFYESTKSLEDFKNGVVKNGGYYLARFEASNSSEIAKTVRGATPWGSLTRGDASYASRHMYNDDDNTLGYQSDLVNSYAWDTAMVFIQKCLKNEAYAMESGVSQTGKLANTGDSILKSDGTKDQRCNICDMAGNVDEWSSEDHSDHSEYCVIRGGNFAADSFGGYATYRINEESDSISVSRGFRPILYVK